MPVTRIKICGVRDVQTALACAEAGVDAIGLVFVPGSPRFVTTQAAREIVRALPALIEPVGLFVNHSADDIKRIAGEVGLRQIQLHGSETAEFARSLKPLSVIKALPFNAQFPQAVLPWLKQASAQPIDTTMACCGLIIDAPPPANHTPGESGGTGHTFDWLALKAHLQTLDSALLPPIILAGGLSPANVAHAIALLKPYAVDVSTGVEQTRGVKSTQLIQHFCQNVRAADL